MKKLTLIIFSAVIVFQLQAQKPLATFFASGGEEFYVIMDGKKINSEPQSRVENIQLDNDWAKVKIVFKNEEILPIEKNIQGVDADGNKSSVTWEISQSGKGKWQIKPTSWSKLEAASTPKSNIIEEPVYEEGPVKENTTTTQTVTTTVQQDPYAGSTVNSGINMNINITDQGETANMNINMSLPGGTVTQSQSSSQTTYTTITTTTVSENTQKESSPAPNNNSKSGCTQPVSKDKFASVKQSIESKSYEDSKLTVAKQVMKSNCLTANQVKEIMMLFTYETSKVDFAKAAYQYTFDVENYYILNDAFTYESSIDELNEYIDKQ
jgi:hypothetical protein